MKNKEIEKDLMNAPSFLGDIVRTGVYRIRIFHVLKVFFIPDKIFIMLHL